MACTHDGQHAAMDRDHLLLTPGPLTTSLRTKLAMLHDWGSWDADFNALTARVRSHLLKIVNAQSSHVLVPLQGSGTFSVEAAVATVVPRHGHLLVLDNGAYGKRAGQLARMIGRQVSMLSFPENEPVCPNALDACLRAESGVTHVLLVHCETGTGVENPLCDVAAVCERHAKGLIVDAMSSFAALPIDAGQCRWDALVAASGKCLEGVPGMGFVFLRQAIVDRCAGNSHSLSMDLHDQFVYMAKTGRWRFTPPTHVVAALSEALAQFEEEGGQPARQRRYRRNCQLLVEGMQQLGLRSFLRPEHQAPIIVTFFAPDHPAYDFGRFYAASKDRGFILYPGKLTAQDTFRVGCIGAIGEVDMRQAVAAIGEALREIGVLPRRPD
jgi:2-aminoethylphosphonate-pyruvate transaminase